MSEPDRSDTLDGRYAKTILAAAERDLLTVQSMSDSAPVESVGFHLQQAAEKALKAWLAAIGETYPLTHNLDTLLGLLSDNGVETGAFEDLSDLTPYAVEFRYDEAGDAALDMTAMRTTVQTLLADVRRMLDAAGPS